MEYFSSRDGGEYGDGMLAVLRIISRVWLGLCGDVLLSGCWKRCKYFDEVGIVHLEYEYNKQSQPLYMSVSSSVTFFHLLIIIIIIFLPFIDFYCDAFYA